MNQDLDSILFSNDKQGQLDDILFNQQSSQGNRNLSIPESQPKQQSAINLTDRLKFRFAGDQASQKQFLESKFSTVKEMENGKFMVGDDITNLQPVDPEGFIGDILGDLADLAPTVINIAGQILGGTIGSVGGPMGTIAGGAAGAGLSEALNKAIGKGMGVNKQTAEDIATEIVATTAFGAAGESLFAGLKLGGKPLMKKIGTLLKGADKIQGDQVAKEKFRAVAADAMNFASGVKKEAVKDYFRLLDKGVDVDDIFSKQNFLETHITNIGDDLISQIKSQKKTLGMAVGNQKGEVLKKVANRKVIDTKEIAGRLLDDLRELGVVRGNQIVDEGEAMKAFIKKSEFRAILDTLDDLGVKSLDADDAVMASVKAGTKLKLDDLKIPFQRADQIKARIGQKAEAIRKASINGSANKNTSRLLMRTIGGEIDDETGELLGGGLRDKMVEVARKAGAERYVQANEDYAKFVGLEGILRKRGMKVDDPVTLTDTFLKKFERGTNSAFDQAVKEFDRLLPRGFVTDLEKYNVAQAFTGTNANFLRLGTIASLAGLTFAPTPEGKLSSAALGLSIGTPTGQRMLLRAAAKGAKFTRSLPKAKLPSIPKNQSDRAIAAMLTQLLDKNSNPVVGNSGV